MLRKVCSNFAEHKQRAGGEKVIKIHFCWVGKAYFHWFGERMKVESIAKL